MLRIWVGPRKGTIITADRKRMKAFPMLIHTEGVLGVMQEQEEFGDIKGIEIMILKKYLPFLTLRAKLTKALEEAILIFLRTYHAKLDMLFDCYAFTNLLAGIPQHNKLFLLNHWRLKRLGWWHKAGDVVFLLGRDPLVFKHSAVYIGWGLYISVYGAGGDLEISTLKDMRRDYEASRVLLAKPISVPR